MYTNTLKRENKTITKIPKGVEKDWTVSDVSLVFGDLGLWQTMRGMRHFAIYVHREMQSSTFEGDLNADCSQCKGAVEKLDALSRCMPDDKEELWEEIEHWVKRFDDAMGEWSAAQKEADDLQVNAQPDEGDVARIMDAEQTEAKDSGEEAQATGVKDVEDKDTRAKEKPTATQESVVGIDEVEEVVVATAEKGDRSSKAVLVISSGVKRGQDKGEEEDEEVTGAWKKRPAPTPVTKEVKGLPRSAKTACNRCREAGRQLRGAERRILQSPKMKPDRSTSAHLVQCGPIEFLVQK
ncbi:hypothetical protein OG21DRAFT_1523196, partial [Imleria badia]